MTIGAICAYLAQVCDGLVIPAIYAATDAVAYTINAKDPPPAGWETAELPGLFVLTGGGTDTGQGDDGGEAIETRTYLVQVAVMPLGRGSARERELRIRPLLEAVKQKYREAVRDTSLDDFFKATVTGDSGPVILGEYDGQFVGFEIRVEVQTWIDP